jgi:hypothetical protein
MNFAGIAAERTRQARAGRARVYSCRYEKKTGRARVYSCRNEKKMIGALAPEASREAAKECSPQRKPWVRMQVRTEPRSGERIEFGRIMRHPERSCFGRPPVFSRGRAERGGAKDLAWSVSGSGARREFAS